MLFIVHFRVLFGKNYQEGIWVPHENQTQHSMVGDVGQLMTRTIPIIDLFVLCKDEKKMQYVNIYKIINTQNMYLEGE